MRITLVIARGGKYTGRRIALRRLPFIIGRDPQCDLRPTHMAISKTHCALEADDSGLVVRDLQSTNGTFVNGQLLRGENSPVHDGDIITIGPLAFAVQLSPARRQLPSEAADTTAAERNDDMDATDEAAEAIAIPLDEAPPSEAPAAATDETQEELGFTVDENDAVAMEVLAAESGPAAAPEEPPAPAAPAAPAEEPEGAANAADKLLRGMRRKRSR